MNNADIIITHAHLTTMIGERPGADALAIADGRITAIGETSALLAQREKNTKVIDAGLNTVMPGIVESHLHLFGGAVELDGLAVNHIKGLQALSDSVCEYAKARGNEPVIVAHGGNHVMLRDHGGITRHDLD
jgi:predicted amidohydrolase YtcJ